MNARDFYYRVCVAVSDAKPKRLRQIAEWLARVFGYGYLLAPTPETKRPTWDLLSEAKGDAQLGRAFLSRWGRRQ